MVGYIYKIVNSVNKKVYIGKTTKSLDERWYEHKLCARMFKNKTYKHQTKLYKAMSKYGEDKFNIYLVEEVRDSDCNLSLREQYWITKYNSIEDGYNISPGGEGGPLFKGHHHSHKTKIQLSKRASKLCWFTDGENDVMAISCPVGFHKGRTKLNVKGKLNPMYGKQSHNKGIPMKESSKQKLKTSLIELNKTRKMVWYTNGEREILINIKSNNNVPDGYYVGRLSKHIKNKRGVLVIDKINDKEYLFDSMSEASRSLGLAFQTIKKSCDYEITIKNNRFLCKYVEEK